MHLANTLPINGLVLSDNKSDWQSEKQETRVNEFINYI